MKKRLIGALASVPAVAAATLCGDSCAASCPYGMVNDPYPGQCGRYTDITGDGICDFSQSTAAVTTDTSDSSTSSSDPTTQGDTGVPDTGGHDNGVNASTTDDPGNGLDNGLHLGDGSNYYILPISLLLISSYLITYYLFKKGILKRNKHRRIWNLLLAAGCLGTSGTGMLLVLLINLGIRTALNPSLIFWHVELAILMVMGTLIHIHIYWKSFKNMFRVLFGFKSSNKKKMKTTGTSK